MRKKKTKSTKGFIELIYYYCIFKKKHIFYVDVSDIKSLVRRRVKQK